MQHLHKKTKKQKNNASSHLSAILQYYNIIIMSFPYRVNSSSPRNVNYIVSSRLIFLRLLSSIVSLHLSPDAISYISSFVSSSVFLIPNRRSYLPLYRATFTLLTLPLCLNSHSITDEQNNQPNGIICLTAISVV